MATRGGPKIITDGLVLYLDAATTKSYPLSGLEWKDLTGNSVSTRINDISLFSIENLFLNLIDNFTVKNDSISLSSTDISVSFFIKMRINSIKTYINRISSPIPADSNENTLITITLKKESGLIHKKVYLNSSLISSSTISKINELSNLNRLRFNKKNNTEIQLRYIAVYDKELTSDEIELNYRSLNKI
jgi:hypothetical protein